MKTTQNQIELIHKEFYETFLNSETELMSVINELSLVKEKESNNKIYNDLSSLGFNNSKTVIKAKTINKTLNNLEHLQNLKQILNDLKFKLPYKIISYGQIISILEKYNLYIGTSKAYTDSIPESCAKDILNYHNSTKEYSYKGLLNMDKPICSQSIGDGYYRYENFYICAPHEMFKKEDRFIVGREIFYNESLKPKFRYIPLTETLDPVVLKPLYINNPIAEDLKLFHVVTAWGPEANDVDVMNPKYN